MSNISNAKISIKEVKTHCGLFDCYTILEIKGFDTPQKLINAKKEFITKSNIKSHKIIVDIKKNNWLNISGKIKGASKNKWNFTIYNEKEKFVLDPWWNSSWNYRKNITIINASTETLIDYVATLNISKLSGMQDNYNDLRFINVSCEKIDGSEMKYEIEKYTSNYAIVHVKFPIFYGKNNTICMYYGNPSANSGEDKYNVWNASYKLVQHLNENSGTTAYDSSQYKNNGTLGGNPQWTNGKVNGALDFDGNDYVQIPDADSLDITDEITLEAWIKSDVSQSGTIRAIFNKNYAYGLYFDHSNADFRGSIFTNDGSSWYNSDGPVTISSGTWHYITGIYNGTYLIFYIDGEEKTKRNVGANAIQITNDPFFIGSATTSTQFFDGKIDEIRISNISRSKGYILQNYKLISDPNNYVIFGSEESQGGEEQQEENGDDIISYETAMNIYIVVLFMLFAMPLLIFTKKLS
ncbi:MAG: DUF2341 domain-containing protein [Promethearchaeia archaeon]